MTNTIDYSGTMYCHIYNEEVDTVICQETLLALDDAMKMKTVPELEGYDHNESLLICNACQYGEENNL